ncbi:MAG TPA: D-amino-acid transaminase [Stellaceae bacterium]|nr:D-amino-acid transaminase [Stellaceae bacterium]
MSRIAYVAGRYLPHHEAAVHIEDRGFQFADGVYEVIAVRGGRLLDEELHLARLHRSLGELRIAPPIGDSALRVVMREVARRNGVRNGIIYLQITRGAAPRDHAFPKSAKPTLVVTSRPSRPPDPRLARDGVAVITIPDIRWQRCDIKSVSLLPNVLGKQQAREAGAFEAWQIDGDGRVTEGTSTNAWIVTADNLVVTRAADHAILNGVTRLAVLDIIAREGYRLAERPFSLAEAHAAREAFLTSTTVDLLPVVRIDGKPVADGKPGPLSRKLQAAYQAHVATAVDAA